MSSAALARRHRTGPYGYLLLPGATSNNATTPDSAALSVTGDIDIRVRVAMNDWTPAALSDFVAKESSSGERSYRFELNSAGTLQFSHSTAAAHGTQILVPSTAAPSFADGRAYWVRVTLDANDGAAHHVITFYTAADSVAVPSSWTQLGDVITVAGAADIYDGAQPLEIGTRFSGTASASAGRFYRVQIRNNILDDGTGIVFDADFTNTGRSFAESANGATVTINGASARASV